MSRDNPAGPEPVKKESKVVVRFSFVGAADFEIVTDNVTPLQLLALASYLEFTGKQMLPHQQAQQLQRAAQMQPRIIVPGGRV